MSYYQKPKKFTTDLVILSILGLVTYPMGIWAVVEFILYLVKDNPFNWTSVILFCIGIVLQVIFFAKRVLKEYK